jgi:integrase
VKKVFEELRGESLSPFYAAFKSEETKENYAIKLRQFLRYIDLSCDEFVELARKDPEKAEKEISRYLIARKEEGVSGSTVSMTRDALKLLLTMNRVKTIDWDIINKMLPSVKRHANDRPPTVEEIRRLLVHADLKLKCAILLLLSSGMRNGALDFLKWGDIEEVRHKDYTFAKVVVYSGEAEEYVTFITPEAYRVLLEYRKVRENAGEKIGRNSPVLINEINKRAKKISLQVRAADSKTVRNRIGRLWREVLTREARKGGGGAQSQRYEFKQVHGFRKFFKTTCEKYMKSLHVELLMGHSIGVSNSYMKPSVEELMDEYVKVIPALTIITPKEATPTTTKEDIIAAVNRQTLLLFGMSEKEIEALGDLSRITPEQMKELINKNSGSTLVQSGSGNANGNGNGTQKVVPLSELRDYIEQGWEFVKEIPSLNEAIIAAPKSLKM